MKKIILTVMSVVLVSSLFIGCGSSDKNTTKNERDTKTKVEENVNKKEKTFENAIYDFTKLNDRVRAEIKIVSIALEDQDIKSIENAKKGLIDKLNNSIATIKEYSNFQGEQAEFIDKAVEYYENIKQFANELVTNGNITEDIAMKHMLKASQVHDECFDIVSKLGY